MGENSGALAIQDSNLSQEGIGSLLDFNANTTASKDGNILPSAPALIGNLYSPTGVFVDFPVDHPGSAAFRAHKSDSAILIDLAALKSGRAVVVDVDTNLLIVGNIASLEKGLSLPANDYCRSAMLGDRAIDKLAVRSNHDRDAAFHAVGELAVLENRLGLVRRQESRPGIGENLALFEDTLCARHEPDTFLMAIVELALPEESCRFVLHGHVGTFIAEDFAVNELSFGLLADVHAFASIIENLAAGKTGLALLADGHACPCILENLALFK